MHAVFEFGFLIFNFMLLWFISNSEVTTVSELLISSSSAGAMENALG